MSDDLHRWLATAATNGGPFWASADGKLGVGGPASTLEALRVLPALGAAPDHPSVLGAAALVRAAVRPDGRLQIAPKGTIHPCHSANGAAVLMAVGQQSQPQTQALLGWLLAHRHTDGGWRCNNFSRGRGPETEAANPGVTLFALDAFKTLPEYHAELAAAVDTLLQHWYSRAPLGPCQFGIGSLFMQVEYPFLRYNLFYYVYVLSFYAHARRHPAFAEALQALLAKRDQQGLLIVERPHRKLANYAAFAKGHGSAAASQCLQEALANLDV